MLGAATVIRPHFGTVAKPELVIRDQEKVELDATTLRQLGDQQTLVIQQLQPLGCQQMGMANLDIQIGTAALANGGGATHAVESQNG